jgi:transcriptional regulator with XRE-family HTH domain
MRRASPVSFIPVRRPEDLASLIRDRREAMGLSQQALADRLGVSRKWVNEIERGHQRLVWSSVL